MSLENAIGLSSWLINSLLISKAGAPSRIAKTGAAPAADAGGFDCLLHLEYLLGPFFLYKFIERLRGHVFLPHIGKEKKRDKKFLVV